MESPDFVSFKDETTAEVEEKVEEVEPKTVVADIMAIDTKPDEAVTKEVAKGFVMAVGAGSTNDASYLQVASAGISALLIMNL